MSLFALTSTSAYAQLFVDADASVTNYTEAEIDPAMSCAALANLELRDVIAISTQTIPGEGEVPSHCRVDGTINPEITFQVNLPIAWNGRSSWVNSRRTL